jgi:hypothetical protein
MKADTLSAKRTDSELAEEYQGWLDTGNREQDFRQFSPASPQDFPVWRDYRTRRLVLAREFFTWLKGACLEFALAGYQRQQLSGMFLRPGLGDQDLSVTAKSSPIKLAANKLIDCNFSPEWGPAKFLGSLWETAIAVKGELQRQQAGERASAEAIRQGQERAKAELQALQEQRKVEQSVSGGFMDAPVIPAPAPPVHPLNEQAKPATPAVKKASPRLVVSGWHPLARAALTLSTKQKPIPQNKQKRK